MKIRQPVKKQTQFAQMGWPVLLLGPGLDPARARALSAPRTGWAGPWENKNIPEAPRACRVVWRDEAPDPSLLSADAGTVGNCVPKL